MSFNFMYIIAVYFFVILVFSEPKYRVHSAIILLFTILNIYFKMPTSTSLEEYVFNRNVNILWDGAAGVLLAFSMVFDRLAGKQALILAFAILCHSMIIYDLTMTQSWFSGFFYTFYGELIILAGLLQMGVSYNGFTTAYDNALCKLQRLVSWTELHYNNLRKGLLARKKREIKT